MDITLYPLLTQRKIVNPIWGGSRLVAWLDLPAPQPDRVGEAWQVYASNQITNGPLAGRSIAEMVSLYGPTFVGERSFARYGADFPLLAKFIDAADRLSIQVHPDDAYAHTREAATGFHGKAEAWYILDTLPGANVTYGLNRPSDRATFAAAVADGSVEDLLQHIPVAPDDVIFVPAGTVHAINAGILLFEIQQKSDLTYRVYDYNRLDAKTGRPRELHLAKALEVSTFGPAYHARMTALAMAPGQDLLAACAYFALERWRLNGAAYPQNRGSFEILTLIGGDCALTWPGGDLALHRGDSVVIPACLSGYALDGEATLLRAYVPDLGQIAADLRALGHPDELIVATLHL